MRFRVLGLLHRLCPALGLAAGLGLVVEVTPTTPAAAASAGVPRFEPAPCPDFPVPELARARCGYLVVRENRARPTGRTIRLIVAILPAASPRPNVEPVVHLASGPGGIGIGEIPFLISSGLNRHHDLIVMDQRGTLLSKPALTCESTTVFDRRQISLRFYSEATKRAHLAATRGCRREVLAKGVDLSAYNSRENAADFADLRQVLGYNRYNVFGLSYGTYLAQTLMRDHPEGIRSVILDSTVPIKIVTLPRFWATLREGFDNLFEACKAQPRCREKAPHLKATFTRLVREFEARPRTVVVANPQGKATKVVLDGGALIDWLRKRAFDTPRLPQVPDQINELARGRLESVATDRAAATVVREPLEGMGLAFGAVCSDYNAFGRDEPVGRRAFPTFPASIQRQLVGSFAYVIEDCAQVWRVPSGSHRPPRADIPTLLVSGTFDSVTSVRWSKLAAQDLQNATVIQILGVGHGVTPHSKCAQEVVASFLAHPNAPDTSCVPKQMMPPFA
jgi:pimeloyl-ACP methyl ester carboxylesterase